MFQAQFLRSPKKFVAAISFVITHIYLVVLIIAGLSSLAIAKHQTGHAFSDNWASTGDFGGVGLLQNRTARFRDDGDFSVGYTALDPYRRYYMSFQFLPWLEGTLRYTEITDKLFSIGGLASDAAFQDRGADLKFLLLEEKKFIPQIALGLQDGIGTGLFSGEFLVASKRYYDFDFSFGVGWGYFASGSSIKNPLININDEFRLRDAAGGFGGEATLANYFSGPNIGLFGGIEWRTPIKGVNLKFEGSTQDYQSEPLGNTFDRDYPFNYGLVYRPLPWVEFTAAHERGNTVMLRANIRANFNSDPVIKSDPPPPKLKPRKTVLKNRFSLPNSNWKGDASFSLKPRHTNRVIYSGEPVKFSPKRIFTAKTNPSERIADALFSGFEALSMQITSIETDDDEIRIYLSNGLREATREVQLDAARLAAALPAVGNRITLLEQRDDIIIHEVSLRRDQIEDRNISDNVHNQLEGVGFTIDSIHMGDTRAQLVISQVPVLDGDIEHAAANIVFNAAPISLEQVEIVQISNGRQLSRAVVRPGDIQRTAMVDQMFDGLEDSGYLVESLDYSVGKIRVHLSNGLTKGSDAYQKRSEAAARLVADHAPEEVSSIEVIQLSAGVEMARVTLRRTEESKFPADRSGPIKASENSTPTLADNEKNEIALKIFKDLEAAHFVVDKFEIEKHKATIFVTPTKFREYARNVGRASRVVASHAPNSIEEIEIVTLNAGLETARVSIMRRDLESGVMGESSPEEIWAHTRVTGPLPTPPFGNGAEKGVTTISNPRRYPTLGFGIMPRLKSHIGGPDGLYLYQIWMQFSVSADLYRGLSFGASFGKNITSTLDKITLDSDSLLPKVRSDLRKYYQEGKDGNIKHLQVDYMFQPMKNWFGRVSAGLFEEMFGGVGGEIMYRPYGSRLALSIDYNRVRQRAFNQRLDFLPYKVNTGHLNIYYRSPFMGLLGEIHAGQFLAGDKGAQFGISRVFDTGIGIGAYVTFTNVSAREFGEGSFDKGIFMNVPLELFLATSIQSYGNWAWRPLSRDGGQRLYMKNRLYGMLRQANIDAIMHDWDQFLD